MGTLGSRALADAYDGRFGAWAPALNAVGESCDEAIWFLGHLARARGGIDRATVAAVPDGTFYEGPRGLVRLAGNLLAQDVYVASLDGLAFAVEDQIAGIG